MAVLHMRVCDCTNTTLLVAALEIQAVINLSIFNYNGGLESFVAFINTPYYTVRARVLS